MNWIFVGTRYPSVPKIFFRLVSRTYRFDSFWKQYNMKTFAKSVWGQLYQYEKIQSKTSSPLLSLANVFLPLKIWRGHLRGGHLTVSSDFTKKTHNFITFLEHLAYINCVPVSEFSLENVKIKMKLVVKYNSKIPNIFKPSKVFVSDKKFQSSRRLLKNIFIFTARREFSGQNCLKSTKSNDLRSKSPFQWSPKVRKTIQISF